MESTSAPNNGNVIEIKDLVKRFGDVTAVDGLSLEVKRGELFGFLGPNGAGKSTTINILCGLLEPTAGSAHVAGYDVTKDATKMHQHIGMCPQEAAVFKFLTGRENIELLGNLHGLEKEVLRERTTSLLDEADFTESAKRRTRGYSGGMMRQLNLLMALIGDPEIVFLDEPTVGMDARARRRTWEYIGSLKDQQKTVVLTTHYIEEAQTLSDRVGIIDYGELVGLGTSEELMGEHEVDDLEAVFLKITGRRIGEGS